MFEKIKFKNIKCIDSDVIGVRCVFFFFFTLCNFEKKIPREKSLFLKSSASMIGFAVLLERLDFFVISIESTLSDINKLKLPFLKKHAVKIKFVLFFKKKSRIENENQI